MTKLKLIPDPTFKKVVSIPVPGGEAQEVELVFKHHTVDGFDKFLDEQRGKSRSFADILGKIIIGWDLDVEYNAENLKLMLQNYHAFGTTVMRSYAEELTQVRLGNSGP